MAPKQSKTPAPEQPAVEPAVKPAEAVQPERGLTKAVGPSSPTSTEKKPISDEAAQAFFKASQQINITMTTADSLINMEATTFNTLRRASQLRRVPLYEMKDLSSKQLMPALKRRLLTRSPGSAPASYSLMDEKGKRVMVSMDSVQKYLTSSDAIGKKTSMEVFYARKIVDSSRVKLQKIAHIELHHKDIEMYLAKKETIENHLAHVNSLVEELVGYAKNPKAGLERAVDAMGREAKLLEGQLALLEGVIKPQLKSVDTDDLTLVKSVTEMKRLGEVLAEIEQVNLIKAVEGRIDKMNNAQTAEQFVSQFGGPEGFQKVLEKYAAPGSEGAAEVATIIHNLLHPPQHNVQGSLMILRAFEEVGNDMEVYATLYDIIQRICNIYIDLAKGEIEYYEKTSALMSSLVTSLKAIDQTLEEMLATQEEEPETEAEGEGAGWLPSLVPQMQLAPAMARVIASKKNSNLKEVKSK